MPLFLCSNHGDKRYSSTEGNAQSDNIRLLEAVEHLDENMHRLGVDYSNMSLQEAEDAYRKAAEEYMRQAQPKSEDEEYEKAMADYYANGDNATAQNTKVDEWYDIPFQESLNLAKENELLDAVYPAYEGQTIDINGVEKTVYNSNGDRIAKSAEALRNFYKLFGDSKVVDEQGRPLVVYHGTNAKFDTFDVKKQGKNDTGFFGRGFYFTPNKKTAEHYANNKIVMPVYINIKNPLDLSDLAYKQINEIGIDKLKELGIYTKEAKDFIENPVEIIKNGKPIKETTTLENYIAEGKLGKKLSDNAKKQGFDGVIVKGKEFVAFEPNQIKSTSNRGTYSESENIYYQSAYEPEAKNSKEKYLSGKQSPIQNLFDIHKNIAETLPEKYTGSRDKKNVLRYIGSEDGKSAKIQTPIESVTFNDNIIHLLEENNSERLEDLNRVIQTLKRPSLIVSNMEKGKEYHYYIKVFKDNDKSVGHLQIVKYKEDGSFYVTNHRLKKKKFETIINNGHIILDASAPTAIGKIQSPSVNNNITQSGGRVNSKNDVYYQSAIQRLLQSTGKGVAKGAYTRITLFTCLKRRMRQPLCTKRRTGSDGNCGGQAQNAVLRCLKKWMRGKMPSLTSGIRLSLKTGIMWLRTPKAMRYMQISSAQKLGISS